MRPPHAAAKASIVRQAACKLVPKNGDKLTALSSPPLKRASPTSRYWCGLRVHAARRLCSQAETALDNLQNLICHTSLSLRFGANDGDSSASCDHRHGCAFPERIAAFKVMEARLRMTTTARPSRTALIPRNVITKPDMARSGLKLVLATHHRAIHFREEGRRVTGDDRNNQLSSVQIRAMSGAHLTIANLHKR